MIIVDTYEKFTQAMEWLNGQEIVSYDIETTGLNTRKDTIIGFGVSSGIDGFYVPILGWGNNGLVRGALYPSSITAILNVLKTKKLLCWNASFDLRFTKNNLGIDLLPALHADVMLMKHTVQEEGNFALKEVAKEIYGPEAVQEQTKLKESIKANGGTAKEYYKADTVILAEYCVKDAELTSRLYSHFSKELKAQGLEDFFYRDEVMPLYREVTIPMEEVGVAIDVPLLKSTQLEIMQDISHLERGIQETIIPLSSVFTTWFLNKDYPPVTWSTKKPSAWTKKYPSQYLAWRAENSGYMFNLQSKHHLKKLFFDTLKETPLSRTPTGQPQVNEEFLDKMALKYDWAAELIKFNKLTKIKTAYVDRLLEEQEDGRWYPSYQMHRTVSGRLAGDFQQLPRQVGPESGELVSRYVNLVRQFIVASPGSKLISADYAQLEPRTFCHVSRDAALKDIFTSGQDFYTVIAQRTEGLDKVSKEARQKAKTYALGIPYGLTGYKLQFELNITQKEGDRLVQEYFTAFPGLHEWFVRSGNLAITEGKVRTDSGRVRHLQRAKECYEHYGHAILDDLQLWHKYHDYPAIYTKAKEDRKTFKNLVNNSRNFQIQGLGASIINRAAIAYNRMSKAHSLKARLVGQVHDELIIECSDSEVETVCALVRDAMENTTKISIPLIASPVVGQKYSECK